MKTIEREVRREINFFSHTFSNIDKKYSMMILRINGWGEVDGAHFDVFLEDLLENLRNF